MLYLGAEKTVKATSFPQKETKYKTSSSKILLNMSRTEIYIADIYQIYSKQGPVSQRHKRHLILPTEFMVSVEYTYNIYPQNERASQLDIRIKLTITKLRIQFSNDDLMIIFETLRREWLPSIKAATAPTAQEIEAKISRPPLICNVFLESVTEEIRIVKL